MPKRHERISRLHNAAIHAQDPSQMVGGAHAFMTRPMMARNSSDLDHCTPRMHSIKVIKDHGQPRKVDGGRMILF